MASMTYDEYANQLEKLTSRYPEWKLSNEEEGGVTAYYKSTIITDNNTEFRNAEEEKSIEKLNNFELAGRQIRLSIKQEAPPPPQIIKEEASIHQRSLDDVGDRQGFSLGAGGRQQLMAKLAQSAGYGMELTASAQMAVLANMRPANPKAFKKPKSTADPKLRNFLFQMLLKSEYDVNLAEIIKWTKKSELEFQLVDPEAVARSWGIQKGGKKTKMDYEKMSRSIRLYYTMNLMKKIPGKDFRYQFIADEWTKAEMEKWSVRRFSIASILGTECTTENNTSNIANDDEEKRKERELLEKDRKKREQRRRDNKSGRKKAKMGEGKRLHRGESEDGNNSSSDSDSDSDDEMRKSLEKTKREKEELDIESILKKAEIDFRAFDGFIQNMSGETRVNIVVMGEEVEVTLILSFDLVFNIPQLSVMLMRTGGLPYAMSELNLLLNSIPLLPSRKLGWFNTNSTRFRDIMEATIQTSLQEGRSLLTRNHFQLIHNTKNRFLG